MTVSYRFDKSQIKDVADNFDKKIKESDLDFLKQPDNFVKKIREKDPDFFMNNKDNIGHCEECPRNIKMKDKNRSILPCGKYVCQVGKE